MLKLIIADDERVIRETISRLIDWESMGIQLTGLCKDGIEAYNMILDEPPDIVLTDIRMPGLSGLELVREIAQTDQQIQFILLSGYEEFDYAREAMQYGVKHYLLKPCNEKKLEETIRQAGADCYKAKKQLEERRRQDAMLRIVHQDAMYHLIMEGMTWKEGERDLFLARLKEQVSFYDQYLEFSQSACYLYRIYYLEQIDLEGFLERMEIYEKQEGRLSVCYGIYVKNTLLLIGYEGGKKELLLRCAGEAAFRVEIVQERYDSLTALLEQVLLGIRRFDTIYALHNYKPVMILNNQSMIRYMQNIYHQLDSRDEENVKKCMRELLVMVEQSSQLEFLQMLGNGLCTRLSAMGALSLPDMTDFLRDLSRERNVEILRKQIVELVTQCAEKLCGSERDCGGLAWRVMDYVEKHLPECDLTLKKIAEEHLYMNVDYVSRQFRRSTGKKFSQYLTEQRIRRAKELLSDADSSKIQYVAERVGCGNNPQYFSQIFKKQEGVTPGKWAEGVRRSNG